MNSFTWVRNLAYASTCQSQRLIKTDDQFQLWLHIQIGMMAVLLILGQNNVLLLAQAFKIAALHGAGLVIYLASSRKGQLKSYAIMLAAGSLPSTAMAGLGIHPLLSNIHLVLVFTYACGLLVAPKVKSAPEDAEAAEKARRLRRARSAPFVRLEFGPVMANYRGSAIHAWFVDSNGNRYEFDRVYTGADKDPIGPDETLVTPGLVYKLKKAD